MDRRARILRGAIHGRAIVLGVALAGSVGCGVGAERSSTLLDDLAAETRGLRLVEPRLSIAGEYAACAPVPAIDTAIASAVCAAPAPASPRLVSLAARTANAARASLDPNALHTAGLIDLLWGQGDATDRSITYLTMAARLSDRPATILSDLAGAYLVRAGRLQDGRDLMMAAEVAAHAIALDSTNGAARFNLALALDRLGLDDQARLAWSTAMAREPVPGWRHEMSVRAASDTASGHVSLPSCGATSAAWRQVADMARQQVETEVWDHILGDWGRAVGRGDSSAASNALACATIISGVLEAAHRDLTVPDAVQAIRIRLQDRRAVSSLARAHASYADARALYLAGDYPHALPGFAHAASLATASLPLNLWSTLFHGSMLVYNGRGAEGEQIMREAMARTDSVRYPGLAGRARWSLGTTLYRSGKALDALRYYTSALLLMQRAGETENVGTLYALRADAQLRLGDRTMYTTATRAMSILRRFRASVWLHGTLNLVATALASDGLDRAAVYFENEQIGVAERTGQRVYVVEAHLERARLLNAIGSGSREAMADLEVAQRGIDSLPGGLPRDWFRATATVTQAEGTAPAITPQALDSAIVFFDRVRNHVWLVPALVDRASLRFDRGDTGASAEDVSEVLEIFDRERASIDTDAFRVSVVRRTRAIADRLVLLRIAAGHPDAALDILEHQRAAVSPYAYVASSITKSKQRDEVTLDYAFIGDTLFTWVLRDTSLSLVRRTVSHADWGRRVERLRAALELRADDRQLRHELGLAYTTLIEPVQAYVPPGAKVAVVADDDIQAIPFAALYDSTHGRFFTEDHVVRFAPSVRDAGERRAFGAKPSAALIADAQLPGARAEVDSIAAIYTDRTILEGSAATTEAITKSLGSARIWHYAGHAILDDAHPERSRLALAALSASDVEHLDLRHLDLVVLSACRTLDAQSTGPGGFSWLAGSFLTAGAGGVIGGLWQVDDARTAHLMIAFHRAYRESGDPPGALRSAQLALLHSNDPALRSPAAWAGFRYVGR